jgi:hypothetical protein
MTFSNDILNRARNLIEASAATESSSRDELRFTRQQGSNKIALWFLTVGAIAGARAISSSVKGGTVKPKKLHRLGCLLILSLVSTKSVNNALKRI